MKVAFIGIGAIGGSVGAWVASRHRYTWFVARGETAKILKANGLTVYRGDDKALTSEHISVQMIEKPSELQSADIIVLGVKNYSLEDAAHQLRADLGDKEPIIVSMANGIQNQKILPNYFKRVVYCVIPFNAWVDSPGVIGYQTRGPLILGTPDNGLQAEMRQIVDLFSPGVQTLITDRLRDTVYCKLAINLVNSVTTLVGFNCPGIQISDMGAFQRIVSQTLWEGVQILKAEGIKEARVGETPGWFLFWASSHLPRAITVGIFRKNVKKMVISSLAQDLWIHHRAQTEFEDINGVLMQLADKHKLPVPFNRTIYRICHEKLASSEHLQLMDVKEILSQVQIEQLDRPKEKSS